MVMGLPAETSPEERPTPTWPDAEWTGELAE